MAHNEAAVLARMEAFFNLHPRRGRFGGGDGSLLPRAAGAPKSKPSSSDSEGAASSPPGKGDRGGGRMPKSHASTGGVSAMKPNGYGVIVRLGPRHIRYYPGVLAHGVVDIIQASSHCVLDHPNVRDGLCPCRAQNLWKPLCKKTHENIAKTHTKDPTTSPRITLKIQHITLKIPRRNP